MKIKCILIEDEISNEKELYFILRRYDDIEIVGMVQNTDEGIDLVKKLRPQAVFLDINVPNFNGIKLAEEIKDVDSTIAVIFVTAYDKYAVAAFEIKALDYILKPFSIARIEKAVERLKEYINVNKSMKEKLFELICEFNNMERKYIINKIPCENKGKIVLVDVNDIYFFYIKSEKTYVKLNDIIYVTSSTLNDMEKKTGFFRAHRSYLVNLNKIFEIYSWFNGTYKLIMSDYRKSEIPVSRGNVRKLKEIINI
ncbi:DNA-binding LytR/AlgR family response regulator [Clostridium acetobutylicum]|uniref:Stage 0 sporulation protein A homolog n=1 Tax=Clostridium acetobutylicum (strain ATCC 824 / DSM 792 / JCM 1419 / IAM 19013 / LMG 5710 / NBRC 13948 / NRRL B-527 / VKM B-1787 / 2291 / W) TaxID=272562 RepID=Q97IH1_CLOAB|nr:MULTISPECIES: LytTR family DNA-binding domain-containing protein [Clostridium]AAK79636.1 Response regulator (CheY-like receiver domain and DNA-binding HTH domain) [Clostridium acetobutylicum ATCC 824]ADZ20720.1 Response regulator (CheY-like receiver domain and DNA-binding HTH domain) [Clostridium acetobutylicum EA 2018]AEI34675.1 response regulator [Clostridium acetobutylicum DSM 1731]AWV79927.1 DNA-binding response regulator [Clostridium acetobutylicum]KHD37968.1 transcriptional regulator 